jgi:hypothetical protein
LLLVKLRIKIGSNCFDLSGHIFFKGSSPDQFLFHREVWGHEIFVPGAEPLYLVIVFLALLSSGFELLVPLVDLLHVMLHLRCKAQEADESLFQVLIISRAVSSTRDLNELWERCNFFLKFFSLGSLIEQRLAWLFNLIWSQWRGRCLLRWQERLNLLEASLNTLEQRVNLPCQGSHPTLSLLKTSKALLWVTLRLHYLIDLSVDFGHKWVWNLYVSFPYDLRARIDINRIEMYLTLSYWKES